MRRVPLAIAFLLAIAVSTLGVTLVAPIDKIGYVYGAENGTRDGMCLSEVCSPAESAVCTTPTSWIRPAMPRGQPMASRDDLRRPPDKASHDRLKLAALRYRRDREA